MAGEEHRPTVLMVGQGEPMQTALGEALRRQGVSVAGCATAELERAVRVYAPDLVVLIGDAAVRGGASVVRRMASNRATDVIPVAVISNGSDNRHEGQDFRTGAVAVVPRSAGADAMARKLTELAAEVPERPGLKTGQINEANIQDVVDLVSKDLRTGILSIRSPAGVVEGMPVIVETEHPSAHNMELILDRLRDAVTSSETLEYEFHETSGGRLSTLTGSGGADEVDLTELRGARLVILDSDELRAEKLAHMLAERGLQIAAADFSAAVIPRVREIDPQIVVLDSAAVGGKGIEFVRAMRKDPQLRWASMLVVRWEDYWSTSSPDAEPDVAQLAARIFPLIEQDLEVARRVEEEVDFDTRLELIGPGRLLRALGSVPGVRRVSVAGSKRSIEIDIADNSILGAYAIVRDHEPEQTLQGIPALLAVWGLNSGRVSVREQDLPSVANIMMPVDEALGIVAHQLGFPDGQSEVEVNAATIPPATPSHREHITVPEMEAPAEREVVAETEYEDFGEQSPQMQVAVGAEPLGAFSEDEVPTTKMAAPLGRVATTRQRKNAGGEVTEDVAESAHIDHAATRKPKATKMGLGPAFELLGEDGLETQKTIPVPEKKEPPPPPAKSQKPAPTPLFRADDDFEPELARVLEGPATLLAPALGGGGMPAWIQVLLLVTVLAGLGVFGWQLWVRSGSSSAGTVEPAPELDAESAKGPIMGPVNGLEAERAEPEPELGGTGEDQGEVELVEPAPAEPKNLKPSPQRPTPRPAALAVPTRGLPKDPAKASDILVHRALPLIRKGELALAEATLDRAWELDPKNPQAMAGYATLYLAKKDGERAEKWALRALRKRSRRAQYHILHGDALAQQGKTEQARKAWRQALSLKPNSKAARSRLAATRAQASNAQVSN